MKEILLMVALGGLMVMMVTSDVDDDTFLLVTGVGIVALLWYVFRSDKKEGA